MLRHFDALKIVKVFVFSENWIMIENKWRVKICTVIVLLLCHAKPISVKIWSSELSLSLLRNLALCTSSSERVKFMQFLTSLRQELANLPVEPFFLILRRFLKIEEKMKILQIPNFSSSLKCHRAKNENYLTWLI